MPNRFQRFIAVLSDVAQKEGLQLTVLSERTAILRGLEREVALSFDPDQRRIDFTSSTPDAPIQSAAVSGDGWICVNVQYNDSELAENLVKVANFDFSGKSTRVRP